MKMERQKRPKMLNRQKCILYMIEQARRPVTRLEVTKWAFLLAQEMPSGGGSSFYDFLPYHYGPFSFTLVHEADRLVRSGYLRDARVGRSDAWERATDVPGDTADLSGSVQSNAARVVERFAAKPAAYLMDYVYEHFPWYTANSRVRQLEKRPVAPLGVYTVGYEGCSVDRLLNVLMLKGIRRIIDVRRNPVARRYGLHKSSLDRLCGKLDIDYVHVPAVGIGCELRRNLDGPDAYSKLFETYERKLLPSEPNAVAAIARMTTEEPAALMCMEADPSMCHRSRLANVIASVTGLPVCHIRGNKCDPVLS